MIELLKEGMWGFLAIIADILFALFYRALNKSFEKNFKKGLLLIIISFICGIILMAVSLNRFAVEHPSSKPFVKEIPKVVLD